ncbi:MAG: hypothetical protein ACYCSY_11465 [Acidiferrobacter sp.]
MTTKIEPFLKELEEFFAPSRRAADKIRQQTLPGEGRTCRALIAYSRGEICRGDAMDLLDIEWYGQLLDALAEHGLDRPDAQLTGRATPLLKEILE